MFLTLALRMLVVLLVAASAVSGEDLFPHKARIRHATGFDVTYHETYKVVRVLRPWKGAKESFTYVLVQEGTPRPDGFDGAQTMTVPARRFVALSSTYLPHVEKIDALDRLVGLGKADFVYSPRIRDRIAEGHIAETGSDGSLNIETLVSLTPDLVMSYGSGNPAGDVHPKLMEIGIPAAVNGEFMEQSPLGRAEWIKFTALFFNLEDRAEVAFAEVEQAYGRLVELAADVPHRPSVFTNISWQGVWHASGGRSFMARLLRDAGADYVWKDNHTDRSIPLDFEAVLEKALQARFWINTGQWTSKAQALESDERYGSFDAFKMDRMYNHNARANNTDGDDYWESGVANPHLVLADLIGIFHPDLLPGHTLHYYRRLP
ncbi:MAG: ABC transporter substrate-binding protein [Gemmatimonadetes bacterium]|nr:ABC transporter substrate-binding protein [Gemmatimonadota bacterium]